MSVEGMSHWSIANHLEKYLLCMLVNSRDPRSAPLWASPIPATSLSSANIGLSFVMGSKSHLNQFHRCLLYHPDHFWSLTAWLPNECHRLLVHLTASVLVGFHLSIGPYHLITSHTVPVHMLLAQRCNLLIGPNQLSQKPTNIMPQNQITVVTNLD